MVEKLQSDPIRRLIVVQSNSDVPVSQRIINRLALAAQLLALIASVIWLANFLLLYLPHGGMHWFPWIFLALVNIYCAVGVRVMRSPSFGEWVRRSIWITQGLLLGMIFAGAWSIGLSFFPSWLLLTTCVLIDRIYKKKSLLEIIFLTLMLIGIAYGQFNILINMSSGLA